MSPELPIGLAGRVLVEHETLRLVPRHGMHLAQVEPFSSIAATRVPEGRGRLLAWPWSILGRGGDGAGDGLELGINGSFEGGPRRGAGLVRKVEPRGVPVEAAGGLVVSMSSLLGGVEGAEPEPGPVARQPDLRHPLAPVPPPHAAVQLPRPHRGLHWLGTRSQPGLRVKKTRARLDMLSMGRSHAGSGGERRGQEQGAKGRRPGRRSISLKRLERSRHEIYVLGNCFRDFFRR